MKTKFYLILLLTSLSTMQWSCKDRVLQSYLANVPIYMSFDEFRSSVKQESASSLEKPTKIYLKDDYLYVNEYLKGIHVFDISQPSNPKNIAFIAIPGNVDMAVQNNRLLADSYTDLLDIDISNKTAITLKTRKEDIFPYTLPAYDKKYPIAPIDQTKGVVTGWEIKEITEEVQTYSFPNVYFDYAKNSLSSDYYEGPGNTIGIGGSMARFTVKDNTMYALNQNSLKIIDISNNSISSAGSIGVNWNAETIFPYGDKLFIGAQNGMSIYDISSPLSPQYISQYNHITACDPVVVSDTIAYITLRTGTWCNTTENRLDVVNLAQIETPTLVHSANFSNPHGLGVSDSLLFVCDGTAGLKIYNKSNPIQFELNTVATFSDIQATDVIPYKNTLILVGDDGLFLYDFSNPKDIKLLSEIKVEK